VGALKTMVWIDHEARVANSMTFQSSRTPAPRVGPGARRRELEPVRETTTVLLSTFYRRQQRMRDALVRRSCGAVHRASLLRGEASISPAAARVVIAGGKLPSPRFADPAVRPRPAPSVAIALRRHDEEGPFGVMK
jgi:hypothetical protein